MEDRRDVSADSLLHLYYVVHATVRPINFYKKNPNDKLCSVYSLAGLSNSKVSNLES